MQLQNPTSCPKLTPGANQAFSFATDNISFATDNNSKSSKSPSPSQNRLSALFEYVKANFKLPEAFRRTKHKIAHNNEIENEVQKKGSGCFAGIFPSKKESLKSEMTSSINKEVLKFEMTSSINKEVLKSEMITSVKKGIEEITNWLIANGNEEIPPFPSKEQINELCDTFLNNPRPTENQIQHDSEGVYWLLTTKDGNGYLPLLHISGEQSDSNCEQSDLSGEQGDVNSEQSDISSEEGEVSSKESDSKNVFIGINLRTGICEVIKKTIIGSDDDFDVNAKALQSTRENLRKLSSHDKKAFVHLKQVVSMPEQHSLFVVEKWYKNGDLLSYLEKGENVEPAQIKKFAENILSANISLIKMGKIFCDNKTENFCVGDSNHAHLGDYDSVKDLNSKNLSSETTIYADPEEFPGGIGFTINSPTFSIGHILHLLFSGKQLDYLSPFNEDLSNLTHAEDLQEYFQSKMTKEAVKNSLPWESEDYVYKSQGEVLVSQMMRANQKDRISLETALEMLKAISAEDLLF